MERYIVFLIFFLYLCPARSLAQRGKQSEADSVSVSGKFAINEDTLRINSPVIDSLQLAPEKFKPDSKKAVLYSAFLPGLGQIYNRKYWKLPIVYGSFLGCAYAITWNGTQYNGYRRAYLDFISGVPREDSAWKDYLYGSYLSTPDSLWSSSMKSNFPKALKSAKDYYRRYRDLSWIISIGVYGLCMIDAYVDAQLFDFDISPNLSMQVMPVLLDQTFGNKRTVGIQLSVVF